ncbi:hypothetical protein [Viscerimonas tarda]
MKRVKLLLSFFLFFIFVASCSEPTLEEDARKAAYLTQQSMTYSRENNLEQAESNYNEVQRIMDKYRQTEDFRKFYDTYDFYLREYLENAEY